MQLALACQQALVHARLTKQHVFGHSGNLGNECADHAAALGTFGLISSLDVATRWIRHNFDAHLYVLMAVITSARSWSDCSTLEQMQRRHLKIGVSVVFTIGFIVFLLLHTHFLCHR